MTFAARAGAARRAMAWAVAWAAAALPAGAATSEYSVTIQQARAGALTVEESASRVQARFSYRDNGRGPDIDENFDLDAAGVPLRYEVRGKSTFGAEIRENFSLADGRARWSSVVDQGERVVEPGALHVPIESTPAHLAQIVRALLQRPGGEGPSMLGTRLQVERLAAVELPGPGTVALYSLTGLHSSPVYLWMREQPGTALFAFVQPGWELVERGHEAFGPQLLQRQLQAERERLEAIHRRVAQPLTGLTLIRNVRWFDARAGRMRGPADIALFEGRITGIATPGHSAPAPAQVIDGRGRTLLPGLFDMHAHMAPDDGLFHLAAGVTSVRDPANDIDFLLELRTRIDAGTQTGPHIHPMGLIEGRSPHALQQGFVIDSVAKGRDAIDWYAARGFRQIKLYNSIRPEWVAPLARHAHSRGLGVGGHVPAFMRAEQAVRAGFDELTHINQLMLNFFTGPKDDTRTLLRFTLAGDRAHELDLDGPRARQFIRLLRQRGTAVDATLVTFESMFSQRDGEPNPAMAAVAAHLPVLIQRSLKASEMSPDAVQIKRYRASWQRMVALVGRLHHAGVPLLAGTDYSAGLALPRELELYVQAGIAPLQALRIATWNGARVAGTLDRRGSIEVGKESDLVLVDGDPERDIGSLRRTSLVIKGRHAYAPDQLWQALGIRPFVAAATIEKTSP